MLLRRSKMYTVCMTILLIPIVYRNIRQYRVKRILYIDGGSHPERGSDKGHVTKTAGTKNSIIATDFTTITSDLSLVMYSAYIDKSTDYVRVIGIIRKGIERVKCLLYYDNTKQYVQVDGIIELLPEDHKRSHTAACVLCPIRTEHEPDDVTLNVPNSKLNVPRKNIPISKINTRMKQYKYTTCVPPLHSNFGDKDLLIEWIEMNLILGAEHIIFYVHKVTNDVMSVLSYYESIGVATLHAWTLPAYFTNLSDLKLHYFGQMAAVNDCVYKTKGMSDFVVPFDTDEFLIPQRTEDWNWDDLITTLPKQSVYIFRCNFFSKSNRCKLKSSCTDKLAIQKYIKKDNIILPPPKRSKYIARPDDVVIAGIHGVVKSTTKSEHVIDPTLGLLHHCRQDKKRYTREPIRQYKDIVAFKYITEVKKNIEITKQNLESFEKI